MNLRILASSTRRSEKSCLLAYQWLSQSTMMPVRKPVGRIFCPIRSTPRTRRASRLHRRPLAAWLSDLFPGWFFKIRQRYTNVRATPFDLVRRAACPRHNPLHNWTAIDARFDDDEVVDVASAAVLRI